MYNDIAMLYLFLSIFFTLVDEQTTIATTANSISLGELQSFNYELVCKESIKVIYAASIPSAKH